MVSVLFPRSVLAIVVSYSMMFTGLNFLAENKLGTSGSTTFVLTMSQTVVNVYNYLPAALVMLLFGETLAKLCGWCKTLEDQAREFLDSAEDMSSGELINTTSS